MANQWPDVAGAGCGRERGPGWAGGLRQLYAGVIDEAVPADLDDLLARLRAVPPCAPATAAN